MSLNAYQPITRKLLKNKLFSFTIKSLLIGGYVMADNQRLEWWQLSRSVILTFSFSFCCVCGIVILLTTDFNPLSMSTAFIFLTTSIAYINISCRKKRLGRMFNFLQADMDKLFINADEREMKMLEETCNFMRYIRIFIYGTTVIAASLFCLDSLYRIVFDREAAINYAKNEAKPGVLLVKVFPLRIIHDDFFMGFIFPVTMVCVGTLYIPLWPVTITNLLSYVNLKWKIMHKRMSEMDVSKVTLEPNEITVYSRFVTEEERINYLRTRLCKFCINELVRIRWLMSQLQELIQIPVFFDFLIYSIAICFVLYEMVTGHHPKIDLTFMAFFEIIVSTILWVYHWNGTLVTDNSYAMCFAVYSSDWCNYSPEIKNMVLMIMLSSADPLEIKAFFITLKVSTFVDIIRTAYTYFSVLRKAS